MWSKRLLCALCFALLSCVLVAGSVEAAVVNINTAGSAELQTLPGIGPTYAQRIIDYRTQNGSYQIIDDIKKVSGIGDATFTKIKGLITVGDVVQPVSTDAAATTTTVSDNDTGTTTPPQSIAPLSAHYSFVPVENTLHPMLTTSIGRDRLGVTRQPLEFQVAANTNDPNISYFWNFGDGSTAEGKKVMHAYTLAGDYEVVLNASLFDNEAVSRSKVKVVDPGLGIAEVTPDYIAVKNGSGYEVNLYGWQLASDKSSFLFPKDTIIGPGQTVKFASSVTKLAAPQLVALKQSRDVNDSAREQKSVATDHAVTLVTAPSRAADIQALADKLLVLKGQLAGMLAKPESTEEVAPQPAAAIEAMSASSSTAATSSSWFVTLKHFFIGSR